MAPLCNRRDRALSSACRYSMTNMSSVLKRSESSCGPSDVTSTRSCKCQEPTWGSSASTNAGFQPIIAGAHNIRLLLMPPGADAMPDQGYAVVIAVLTKLAGGKRMNGTGFDPRLALLDGPAVDVTHEAVDAPLLRRGLPEYNGAGLMAGVAVAVSHIIVADDIARLENGIAFPAIGDGVPTGIQNAMGPLRAPPETTLHQAAVHGAFRFAHAHAGKDFEIGVVQQVCGVLEQVDFARSLDPAHARHHRRTINQGGGRQQGVEFFPACSAHVRFFDPDHFPLPPEVLEDDRQTLIGRLGVVIIDFHAPYPRVASGQRGSVVINDQHGFPVTRPEHEHFTGRVREVKMPRQRAGIGKPRQIGKVLARARHDGGTAVLVHQAVQALDVGHDVSLRSWHGDPSCAIGECPKRWAAH